MPLMPDISTHGFWLDDSLLIITVVTVIIALLSFALVIAACINYRQGKHPRATLHLSGWITRLIILDIAMVVFDIAIAVYSTIGWYETIIKSEDALAKAHGEPMHVNVVGRQFFWSFNYTGPDGKFGTADDFALANDLVVEENKLIIPLLLRGQGLPLLIDKQYVDVAKGQMPPPELLDRLVVAMRDPADEVWLQAAHTLNGLNPDDVEPYRERLVELLETENDELQEAVCKLLSRCYQHDWRALADRLMGAEKTASLRGLIRTLSLIGDPQIGVLFLPILDHKEGDIRELAAEQLYHVASRLPRESLVRYLEDPNERVRTAIVRCLGKQMGAEVVAPLVERTLDPSALVRQEVAAAFGRASDLQDEQPVQALTKMAKDGSVLVRAQALASLIRLGVTGQRKIFEEACRDLDEADLVALRARLNKDGTLYQMLEIMKTDRGAQKRADAVYFLAQADLERYAPDIALALQDPASAVRIEAIEALGQHEDPGIQKAIEALGRDPVDAVRGAVQRRRLRSLSPRKQA
ncbi:MAG: HEAT repeat domain-containing protein [Bacteroidetes bacterium]|nr:HEAT repeat domain-containing protein [Bacteroidota bacterium]